MNLKKILFILVLCLIPVFKVNAASFSVSASSKEVTVGSKVTIYINGSDVAGKVNVTSSNTSVLSSSDSSVWIEPNGQVSFTAKKTGSSTITVSPSSLSDNNGNDVELSSKSITINVIEKKTYVASSNNSLSSLSVDGLELSPSFDSGTTEYSVTAKEGTESINIKAIPADNKSNVSGVGNVNVSSGLNVIEVIVTAENGYEKKYTLNVTVEDELINVSIDNQDYSLIKQASFLPSVSSYYSVSNIEYKYKVDGDELTFEIPTYYSDVTGYNLVGLKNSDGIINLYIYNEDDKSFTKYEELNFNQIVLYSIDTKDIRKDYKKKNIIINDKEIVVYQKDKSDFYLVYGMDVNTGNKEWYKYDSKENTIQRYDQEEIDELTSNNDKYLNTIYVMSGISIVLIMFILVLIIKNRKSKI